MNAKFPSFVNGTKIVLQPNCCFVYSWQKSTFDFFNLESAIFFNEMNGAISTSQIIDNVSANYPEAPRKVIEDDLCKLQACLVARGYLRMNDDPQSNTDVFELADRLNEVKIVQADVEITKNCNLRCKYCYNESADGNPELTIAQWTELLDSLHCAGLRAIKVSGGEPFQYPNILDFLEYAQSKFIVSINTSGYFIDDAVVQRLSTMRLQAVQVSLDSATAKAHDTFRGKGTWEKAIRSIKLLHGMGIPIRVSTTVSSLNHDEIGDIKKLADSYGAELSLEVLEKVGKASSLDSAFFVSDPKNVREYSNKLDAHRLLGELEMSCQAQLGIVGVSYRGNIKPCNLTEDFFSDRNAGVVVKFDKTSRYSDSPTLVNVNAASYKAIRLSSDKGKEAPYKCIFEH